MRPAARAGRSRNWGTEAVGIRHTPLTAAATATVDAQVQAPTLQQLGVAGLCDVPRCSGPWSMPCDIDDMHGGVALMQTIMIGCQAVNSAITAIAVDARKKRDARVRMTRNFTSARWRVKTNLRPRTRGAREPNRTHAQGATDVLVGYVRAGLGGGAAVQVLAPTVSPNVSSTEPSGVSRQSRATRPRNGAINLTRYIRNFMFRAWWFIGRVS